MKSRGRLIALGAGVYLLFVLLSFPARLALQWFAPPELQLAGVSGTIWNGGARGAAVRGIGLGKISWRLKPLQLLAGRLAYHIEARRSDGFLKLDLARGFGGTLYLGDLTGTLPIAALSELIPTNTVDGEVILQLDKVQLVAGWPEQARGTVNLARFAMTRPVIQELGNFEIRFSDDDPDVLRGIFRHLSGPLSVQGTVTLNRDRSYNVEGRVAARSDAPAEITNMLQFLGSPESDGRRPFSLAGRL